MSADVLRQAASLMRERAEAATPAPWSYADNAVFAAPGFGMVCGMGSEINAEHIASWHPAVAFAVSDWLSFTAAWLDREYPETGYPMDWSTSTGTTARMVNASLTVARIYLGKAS